MTTSRRSVLKKGLTGGAILALGGTGLALRPSALVDAPRQALKILTLREYSILHALAHRLIPPLAGFPSIDTVNVVANADGIIARLDEGARAELRQLIGLFENALAGLFFGGRITPFTHLSEADQDQVLREWQNSALVIRRSGFSALRSLLLAAYYASPLVWPSVGYEGPPPGFHQKDAPVWTGGGEPRPPGNGVETP
ncbi:MAG: gluconate 2-dehydrogenase subunit 3 family protein [Myxococcaceae bacterium]